MKLPRDIVQHFKSVGTKIIESVEILNSVNIHCKTSDGHEYISTWTFNAGSGAWNQKCRTRVSDHHGNAPIPYAKDASASTPEIADEYSKSRKEILEVKKLQSGVVVVATINRVCADTTTIDTWTVSPRSKELYIQGSVIIFNNIGRVVAETL